MNAFTRSLVVGVFALVLGCGGPASDSTDGGPLPDGAPATSDGGIDGGDGSPPTSCGGSAAGILDPMRSIDWSQVGVGGIPARATACATLDASASGNGTTDATAKIQAALDACPAGQAVVLSAGTFLVASHVNVPANVTLRGAGADQTVLDAKGSGSGVVQLGTGGFTSTAVGITGGATRGSTSLTLSSATGVTAGSYLLVTELNDPSFVSIEGGEGTCTWCDTYWNGTRARGQIVEVSSVSGNTVTTSPPLYSDYSRTPQAAPFAAVKYAGVEDVQIYANHTGYTSSFYLSGCAYCWVKGVEANYTDGDYVEVHSGFRDEIRDSYFSNAYGHVPGTTDSDVFIASKTTATLVENNIIERAHVAIMINWGAAGNVVAYNYTQGEFDSNATNVVIGGIGMHGAHPQFNLVEGNVSTEFSPDQIWGSSSHNTTFRNWITGTTQVCVPATGRGPVDCSGANGHFAFQSSRAMQIGHLSTSINFVGNVVGSVEQSSLHACGNASVMPAVAILQWPSTRSYDATVYGFTFGYGEASDDGSSTGCAGGSAPPCHGTEAYTSALLHGNYTHADGAIAWSGATSHALPCSMYLASKPAFWGSLPFPATGPEVTGGSGPGGHSYGNAAMSCYMTKMSGSIGGAGTPLKFNAKSCYGS